MTWSSIPGSGGGGGGPSEVIVSGGGAIYFVDAEALLTSPVTINEVPSAGTAGDHTQYIVTDVFPVSAPLEDVAAIFATLVWTSSVDVGEGLTRWYLSEAAESVGAAPSGSAIIITEDIPTNESPHQLSGRLRGSANPSGSFRLVLAAKPDSPGSTVSTAVRDESSVELAY